MTHRTRRASRRHLRWFVAGGVCAVVAIAASDVVLVRAVSAQPDDQLASNYGLYIGSISATADREQVGTTQDVNFTNGAVNNFYPLAYSQVAVAGTDATASPADTGPLAQAVFGGGGVNPPLPVQQGQYVHAQFPGTENPPPYQSQVTGPTGGTTTVSSASASVTQASARATAFEASSGTPPDAAEESTQSETTLADLLAQWQRQYLGNPSALPAAVNPQLDGADGITGFDNAYFDDNLGFVTTGTSRVQHASFGGGLIVLDKVSLTVTVSNKGDGSAPATSVSVQVGSATIGGVPVTIGQNGVSVATGVGGVPSTIPLDAVQSASAALNSALSAAGFSIGLVAPVRTTQGSDEHVDAFGVQVAWQQPGVTPAGVPSQNAAHYLGEVEVDNEAMLAPPVPAFNGASSTTTTTYGGGAAPAPGVSAPPSPSATSSTTHTALQPASVAVRAPRPLWLLLLYFAWQALMIATAASIYLWRRPASAART